MKTSDDSKNPLRYSGRKVSSRAFEDLRSFNHVVTPVSSEEIGDDAGPRIEKNGEEPFFKPRLRIRKRKR